MKMKTRATAVMVLALVFGMLAIPAWAQEADEDPEVASLEDCLLAFEAGFEDVLDAAGVTDTDSFAAWLDAEGFDVDEACEIGGTYVADVLEVVLEEPEEEAMPVTTPVDPPAQVRGRVLAVTGTNGAILALFGVTLLGLGIVAVRGTRRRTDAA